jgi:hypothetical protein
MLARRRDHCPIRFGNALVTEIAVDPHFGAQIIGTDQQGIDPRHRCNLFGIGDERVNAAAQAVLCSIAA